MDYLVYFAAITAAVIAAGCTVIIFYKQIRRAERREHENKQGRTAGQAIRDHQIQEQGPLRWFWWVGRDPELKKEYIVAVMAHSHNDATSKLNPQTLKTIATARVKGIGNHVLVARSLSEINVEGT